tara:strand:- start:13090 stop:15072 length:1983 start_codon:yes stop_codon:yes gene_type:complete
MSDILRNIQTALGNPKRDDVLSFTGILIVLGIVFVLNALVSFLPFRADLTQHNIYTLSSGTKAIVKGLDTPVKIRYFVTDDRDMMSPEERNLARAVEDRLLEYKKLGRGNLIFEKLNPEPDTNAEDAAEMAGLQPLRGQRGQIYMGVVVECLDEKEVIPYIDPNREELLEYDITNAISRVYRDEKPKITVMTAMNVAGGFSGGNFQGGPAPAWFFYRQLERDYQVETIPSNTEKIDEDTDVLLVLHPYDITDVGEYAIDQYLLSGGAVIAVVDPLFYSARALTPPQQQQNPFGGAPPSAGPLPSSDLPTLFEAWGVEYQSSQVLADAAFRTEIERNRFLPTLLSLGQEAMNDEDVVTSQMVDVYLPFPGGFKISKKDGVELETLVTSSEQTQMVNSFEAEPSALDQLERDFRPTGETYQLVTRLKGNFKSAFPDGDPNAEPDAEDASPEEGDDAEKEEAKKEGKEGSLKESEKEGVVVLIADVDMFYDQFSVRQLPIPGYAQPLNQNLSLLQNVVEVLSDKEGYLVSLRSRASTRRPFTKLNEMQAKAEAQMVDRIEKLEKQRDEVSRKLQEALQIEETGDGGTQLFIDPAAIDQGMIERMREEEYQASLAVRELRKQLKRRKDSFVNLVKFVNIAVMPLVVIVLGLIVYGKRQTRMAAR